MARSSDHLLVVRLSALGDVAMTVPVLSALRKTYPELRITVLTRPFFKPLFEPLPDVTVFEADLKGRHKGIRGLWLLHCELKSLGTSGVADLHNVLRTNILKVFSVFSKARFVQIDKGRLEKRRLTRSRNKIFKPLKTTFERYAEVFSRLGYPVELTGELCHQMEKLPDPVREFLGEKTTKWVGIAPFAAFQGKMYPLELMKEVIGILSGEAEVKLLLFGGGSREIDLLDKLAGEYPTAVNVAGKFDFRAELALISNLDLMVSMDSANAHLASLYGIPTITLWGVTHPYAGFYPFGQATANALLADRAAFPDIPTSVYGKKMPEGYEEAMATIAPTEVVAKIKNLLA